MNVGDVVRFRRLSSFERGLFKITARRERRDMFGRVNVLLDIDAVDGFAKFMVMEADIELV